MRLRFVLVLLSVASIPVAFCTETQRMDRSRPSLAEMTESVPARAGER